MVGIINLYKSRKKYTHCADIQTVQPRLNQSAGPLLDPSKRERVEKSYVGELQMQSGSGIIPIKSFNSRYQLCKKLGSGSFGTVSLYKLKPGVMEQLLNDMENCQGSLLNPLSIKYKYSNDLVAIKTMNKKLKRITDYSRIKEIQFIFSVDSHFNLVQIVDVFIDRTQLKLNIVMENLDQNLYQLMKSRKNNIFSARTLKSILSQLLSAIRHIHQYAFFHRDVKPENILVMHNVNYFGSRSNIPASQFQNSYIIKLADYGLARHENNEKQFTAYVSTRWYRSPEILLRQSHYSFPVDVWAFGCVAVECATFIPMFPGSNELDQCCKVMEFLGNPTKEFYDRATNERQKDGKLYLQSNSYYHIPFGGFWDEAQPLADKLGLIFPSHFGYRLEGYIQKSDFTMQEKNDFFQMVTSCLTWDPEKRVTAQSLCNLPYFRNYVTSLNSQKENDYMVRNSYSHNYTYGTNNIALPIPVHAAANQVPHQNYDSTFKSSMLFAGIAPSRVVHENQQHTYQSTGKIMETPILHRQENSTQNHKQPIGLGFKSKFNMFGKQPTVVTASSKKDIVPSIAGQQSTHIPQSNNSKSYPAVKPFKTDHTQQSFQSDPIDDYVSMFPKDSNFNEFENTEIAGIDDEIDVPLENVDVNGNDVGELEALRVEQLLAQSKSFNATKTDGCPHEVVDHIGQTNDEDDDDDDQEEDDEELENELMSLELGKVSVFLHDSELQEKASNNPVSINNTSERNYDLIDAINFALDDEYQNSHLDMHSWQRENN